MPDVIAIAVRFTSGEKALYHLQNSGEHQTHWDARMATIRELSERPRAVLVAVK